MTLLYKKIEQVSQSKQGRINILHIGDSHIQAGDISHQLRTHLTDMAPNLAADRGMLFPLRAIKTNGPLNYRLGYEGRWVGARNIQATPATALGLTGATATTADSAAHLYLNLRENGKWNFNQLHIFGEASDSTVYPILITQKGDTLLSTQTKMQQPYSIFELPADGLDLPGYHFILPEADSACTLSFVGLCHVLPEPISKKKGRRPTPNYAPLDSIHHFTLRGILPESDRPGITYTECGINGAALASWLRCSEQRFREELTHNRPDLIILSVGTNDANMPKAEFDSAVFKAEYRQLIGRIKKINPETAILFVTSNDCWISTPRYKRLPNLNTPIVEKAFFELAKEYDAAVFDLFAAMRGHKSADRWVKEKLMQRDHIHFTREGYFLWGDLIYNALVRDFEKWTINTNNDQ